MKVDRAICVVFVVTAITHSCFGRDLKCAEPLTCKSREKCNEEHNGQLKELKVILRECNAAHRRICCPAVVNRKVSPIIVEDSTTTSTTTTVSITTTRPTEPLADIKTHQNFGLLPDLTKCGHRNPKKRTRRDLSDVVIDPFTHNKVSGGDEARRGDFPWMALLCHEAKCVALRCGGTIINKRYILTAAHCLHDKQGNEVKPKYVRLGVHNNTEVCTKENKKLCPQEVKVEKVIKHEAYSTSTKRNDIALLRLEADVLPNDNENIAPICLPFDPLSGVDMSGRFTVAGWGLTDWIDARSYTSVLMTATFRNSNQCSTCISSDVSPWCPLDPTRTLCIQAISNKDTCKGDSGGPIMVKQDPSHQWVQVGVTSFKTGKQCGLSGLPSIYTRVDGYLNWILDNIEP